MKTARTPAMLSREKVQVSLRYGQRQLGRLGIVRYLTMLGSLKLASLQLPCVFQLRCFQLRLYLQLPCVPTGRVC